MVADQHGSPTSAGRSGRRDPRPWPAGSRQGGTGCGTFHFAGGGVTSWHGFAAAVMELCLPPGQPRPELVPIATPDFPRPAPPPGELGARLHAGSAQVYGIVPRPWREALADVGRELRAAG